MIRTITMLKADSRISDWKLNIHRRESYELFFVKEKLDCVRRTDTTNNRVTVYVDNEGFRGDAMFYIYPASTEEEREALIDSAVSRARLVKNAPYTLPAGGEEKYIIESNFSEYDPIELAKTIASEVFASNKTETAAINSLEVFVTKHHEEIINSAGISKSQVHYDAMVEAIPTFNGESQSVELYEQYNFSILDIPALREEISGKMAEVKARSEALTPEVSPSCPVILNKAELSQLFRTMVADLDYAQVYYSSNLYKKGDKIQPEGSGDRIGITLKGEIAGSCRSSRFDMDGITLGALRVIDKGAVAAYHGSNKFAQYIGEEPSGDLPCMELDPGSTPPARFCEGPYLEIISMSGLQVDFYNDYIGGEIRLAYYNDGTAVTPLTGISVSGKLSEVLAEITLSSGRALCGGYFGPEKALIKNMKIF